MKTLGNPIDNPIDTNSAIDNRQVLSIGLDWQPCLSVPFKFINFFTDFVDNNNKYACCSLTAILVQ